MSLIPYYLQYVSEICEGTRKALVAFQKANGLGVDGIVGPLTWAKLG